MAFSVAVIINASGIPSCSDDTFVTSPGPCSDICINVTDGGKIGFGPNCDGIFEICGPAGVGPFIRDCVTPSGGSGAFEIIWIRNPVNCDPIGVTVEQLINDPSSSPWEIVPGATGLDLDLSNEIIATTTCYQRCTRRAGCEQYLGETDAIQVFVNPDCPPSGLPDCNNISITTGNSLITISGLSGAPVSSVQIFTGNYSGTVFSCYDDCGGNTINVPVTPGTYQVKVNYANESYIGICEVNQTVFVNNNLLTANNFNFDVIKHEEHAELLWLHNQGELVTDYVIEHSVDGLNFEALNEYASKGGVNYELYKGFDMAPAIGDNFYRVKLNFQDGTVAYSEVKFIKYADLIHLVLFPNPADDFVKVNLEDVIGTKDVKITIFNNLGLTMKTFDIEEVSGRFYQMDIRELREGHYVVWVHIPGRRPIAKQLVVGKL